MTGTTKFGRYEILAPLGAGGTGDVYRARDPRLRREVALKILSRARGDDSERQRRLLQEARAASALNHPNILVVFDVASEDGVPYIVSELVDGHPLRKEMRRGPMPLQQLLDVAVQIADGLAAAHDGGIVHRDLKPENIVLTREGRVKIVDFGLAKPHPALAADHAAGSETPDAGLLLGTIAYMSPEQARGEPADFRSDQFAVGLMLYEMATGKHPLRRETTVQTLSAIIGEDPQPLSHSSLRLPAPLRWLIERCLAKEPRQRYAATRDLHHDLVTLRAHLTGGTWNDAAAPLRAARPTRRRVAAAALLASVSVAVLAAALWLLPDAPDYAAYRFTPLATESGYQGSPAWSPDGKTLAYVAEKDGVIQVFTRALTSTTSGQITHSDFDCRDPFWSPDGTRLFYISLAREKEGVWSASAAGGTPEIVMEDATAAAISPDGQTLAFFREEGAPGSGWKSFWLSSPPGRQPRRYPRLPPSARFNDAAVHFSPDGSRIGIWGAMFNEQTPGPDGARAFWVIPLPDGAPYIVDALSNLPPTWPSFSWLPDNRHIVATILRPPTPGTHLWLLDTQGSRAPQPVTLGVHNESFPAVAPDGGRVAFNSEQVDFDLVEIPLDGSPVTTLLQTSRNEMDPAWSPAGDRYAFVTDRMGNQQIWLRSRAGQWDERPLVTEKDFGGSRTYLLSAPTFSPDGLRLAYSRQGAASAIWISTLAGIPPIPLLVTREFQDAPTWSPDGNWIAYTTASGARWRLAKAQVGGGGSPVVIKDGITPLTRPQWSPDGRWIACDTPRGLSVLSPEGRERVLNDASWLAYGWSADSSLLYGLRQRDDVRHLMLASIDLETGRERTLAADLGPVPLANFPVRGFTRISNRSFATSLVRVRADVWLLEGFAPPGLFARVWPTRVVLRP